jgi:hypothetical protein
MLAREAHHRGQICMLAHQMGFPLPYKASDGIWNWKMLWRECVSPRGPGHDQLINDHCELSYGYILCSVRANGIVSRT